MACPICLNPLTQRNVNPILYHGAIAASDWVDRLFHKKPLPAGCREVLKCQVPALPEKQRKAAERVLRDRPRVRKIIIAP